MLAIESVRGTVPGPPNGEQKENDRLAISNMNHLNSFEYDRTDSFGFSHRSFWRLPAILRPPLSAG